MTETEINKALALKIGYLPEHVNVAKDGLVSVCRTAFFGRYWSQFDFMDWNTIMPIAVKYGVETGCNRFSHYAYLPSKRMAAVHEKTLQKAIALAVLNNP